MGLALIAGILIWINRRTRRRNERNKFSQEDYTLDMNQNDFNHSSVPIGTTAAAAAGGAIATSGTTKIASNEPLSPFDHSRRFAPTQPGYGEPPAVYPDYHENYSQAGYSQGGYSQEGYNQDYPQPYGYYDNGYAQDPYQTTTTTAAGYDQYHPQPGYYEQPNVYANPTSPTSAGNLSDKPNVKDYSSKPNEL